MPCKGVTMITVSQYTMRPTKWLKNPVISEPIN